MDITNFYYDFVVGEYPSGENYNKTELVIKHLQQAGFNDKELLTIVINDFPNKDILGFEDIPNSLWEKTLLRKEVFYFHKELQVVSPPPMWDPIANKITTVPFFLEMKIRYTEEDILKYFINILNIREEWVSREKELGSIRYLLEKYKKFNFVEPVDFILHLVDYCSSLDNVKIATIYDLCYYETMCAEYLEADIKNARVANKNKIIWRKA